MGDEGNPPIKVIFIGDSYVGKTTMLSAMRDNKYSPFNMPTVSASYTSLDVESNGEKIKLQMWDTAGEERFRSFTKLYMSNASIVLCVFSLTVRETFNNVGSWKKTVSDSASPDAVMFLIGNKSDDAENRQVSEEEAVQKAEDLGFYQYHEVSSKTMSNIDNLKESMAEVALNLRKSKTDVSTVTIDVTLPQKSEQGCC